MVRACLRFRRFYTGKDMAWAGFECPGVGRPLGWAVRVLRGCAEWRRRSCLRRNDGKEGRRNGGEGCGMSGGGSGAVRAVVLARCLPPPT